MKFRIRNRVMISYLLLIFISMSSLGVGLILLLQNYFIDRVENELVKEGKLIANIVNNYLVEEDFDEINGLTKDLSKRVDTRITVIFKDGKVLGDSHYDIDKMENHSKRPEVQKALQGGKGVSKRFSNTLDSDTMYIALPLEVDKNILGVIRLALPLTEINKTLFNLAIILLSSILFAATISVLVSLKLSQTITEPIEKISNTAYKISKGDLKQKIYCPTQDELGSLSVAINDMTLALKRQIYETRAGKKRIEAILNNMSSGVLVISRKGIIREINPHLEKIFGVDRESVLGKSYQLIIRNFDLQEKIEQTIKEKIQTTSEFSIIYPENHTLKAYIAPVIQDKKLMQIAVVFHDITSLRKIEKMKTDFVANASHELRTPVAAIKGFSETLLDGAMDNPKLRQRFIGIIDKEAERLIKLINELLDLSKLERKNEKIDLAKVDIKDLITECCKNLDDYAKKSGVSILLDLKENLPKVNVNLEMITQALINLIDNGIKYNKKGGNLEIVGYQMDDNVIVEFKDTGLGISKEDLPRIFERFYRVDKARSKEVGGTGLGLSIVKHIIEVNKAKIFVESELDKGTKFSIYFPVNTN